MKGYIVTFGKKAVAIQTENKDQYYAPYEDVDELIKQNLDTDMPIVVAFEVDLTRYAGHSNDKPRYYAKNVQLRDVVHV